MNDCIIQIDKFYKPNSEYKAQKEIKNRNQNRAVAIGFLALCMISMIGWTITNGYREISASDCSDRISKNILEDDMEIKNYINGRYITQGMYQILSEKFCPPEYTREAALGTMMIFSIILMIGSIFHRCEVIDNKIKKLN
jgi:hypothetical protein